MRQTPVGVGSDDLADHQRCVGQPTGMLEPSAVSLDQPQRRDGAEAAGKAYSREDRPIEQRLRPLSWRPLHGPGFLGFALERDRREHVDEDFEPENLDRQEGLVEARDSSDQDETEHRHVCGDEEDQALLDVGHQTASLSQTIHQGHERVIAKDQVGGFAGHSRAAAHGHGYVGAVQGRGIVHSVTGDGHGPVGPAGDVDYPQLLLRKGSGHDIQCRQFGCQAIIVPGRQLGPSNDALVRKTGFRRDGRGCGGMVTGHNHGLDARGDRQDHSLAYAGTDTIGEREHTQGQPIPALLASSQQQKPLARLGAALDEILPGAAFHRGEA